MPLLTERQKEYLMLYAMRNGRDRWLTEAAKAFQVSKPSAHSITDLLEKRGMVRRTQNGEIELTQRGWDSIQTELHYQASLFRWFTAELGMEPVIAEQESRRMATALRPETLESILRFTCTGKPSVSADRASALESLPPGLYELPFVVCKRDTRELSMGDRGFQKPALLRKSGEDCSVFLYARQIDYRPENRNNMHGSLDRMWYRLDGTWREAEQGKDGGYRIPELAVRYEQTGHENMGLVRIRVRASVGISGMPESEADLIFFVDKIREQNAQKGDDIL